MTFSGCLIWQVSPLERLSRNGSNGLRESHSRIVSVFMDLPRCSVYKIVYHSSGKILRVAIVRYLDACRSSPRIIAVLGSQTIVTLGDYVNRGPDSKGVIDTLIDLRQVCNLVSILGNHDKLMLSARDAEWANSAFLYQGGSETLASYHPDASLEHVPQEHWEFFWLDVYRFTNTATTSSRTPTTAGTRRSLNNHQNYSAGPLLTKAHPNHT